MLVRFYMAVRQLYITKYNKRGKVMEQSKKNLKSMSIVMLILAGLSLVSFILDLIFTDYNVEAFEGVSKEVLTAAVIIVGILGFIILLPQVYIGIKGIKVAKNPDSSKAHIVWATILFIISVIGVVLFSAQVFASDKSGAMSAVKICDVVIDVMLYCMYLQYAREVRAGVAA